MRSCCSRRFEQPVVEAEDRGRRGECECCRRAVLKVWVAAVVAVVGG